MKEKTDSAVSENLKKAMETLCPTREEVRARFSDLLAEWREEREGQRRSSCSGALHRLWQGISIRLMEGMREFEAGLAEMAQGSAFTTRGLEKGLSVQAKGADKAGEDRAQGLVFIQAGDGCYGRVAVNPAAGGKANLEFSLRDRQNQPIKPFRLTVERGDNRVLLNRKEVAGEAYAVKDIEIDDYFFLLESADGKHRVRMGWQAVKTSAGDG